MEILSAGFSRGWRDTTGTPADCVPKERVIGRVTIVSCKGAQSDWIAYRTIESAVECLSFPIGKCKTETSLDGRNRQYRKYCSSRLRK
jgi:hypothetical protein